MMFRSIHGAINRALRGRGGGFFAACLVVALCLAPSLAAEKAVYYSKGKAVPLVELPNRLLIQFDRQADHKQAAQTLADRGYATLLAPNYGAVLRGIRTVPVASVDEATMKSLRDVPGIAQVRRVYQVQGTDDTMLVADQIIVRFPAGTAVADVDACLADHGCVRVEAIGTYEGKYLAKLASVEGNTVASSAALHEDPRTVYCHPDFLLELERFQISDTYYGDEWHLNNTGQRGATVDADVDWAEAWALVSGLEEVGQVRIAINDDSLQFNHVDLASGFVIGYDAFDRDSDPTPGFSGENHGTAVAGVATSRLNGFGTVGAAPTSQLIGIRLGLFLFSSDAVAAYQWVSTQDPDVINNSWGMPLVDAIAEEIRQLYQNGRDGLGTVIVYSAGNTPAEVSLVNPFAAMPETIAIGGSNSADKRASYSTYGPEVSVLVPTWDIGFLGITTTDVSDDPNLGLPTQGYNVGGVNSFGPDYADGSYSQWFGGTSSSAPLATGVIALILGTNPNLTVEQVRRILEHTADQIDPVAANYDSITGFSEFYSYGRLNAYRAVLAAQAAATGEGNLTWPPPVANLKQSGSATINLRWDLPQQGQPDSVLVVHSNSPITWTPSGMRQGQAATDYTVGNFVAPGVQVVMNKKAEEYEADPGPGQHYYAVYVRNSANRWSWGRSVDTVLGAKSAPKASVSASRRAGSAPLEVTFAGGALDSDLEDVDFSFSWQFGDGTTGTGQSVTHTYAEPGMYMARMTAEDPTGLTGSASIMIEVSSVGNKAPSVQILSPGDGEAPHTVLLRAVASDPDGSDSELLYTWSFGDGADSVAAGEIVEHTYTSPGAYAATVTVTDSDGASSSATVVISVFDSSTGATKPADGSEAGDGNESGQSPCSLFAPPLAALMMLGLFLLTSRRRR